MDTSFNREIQPAIFALGQDVLSKEQLDGAEGLSELLLKSEEDRQHAIAHLRELMGNSPKRPVFYLDHEIGGLPDHTRHVVRYAGDYIDQMIKYCSYDKGDFLLLKFRGLRSSLGINLKRLRKVLPERLLNLLTRFNEVIYVPSKHDWEVGDRPHLFSAKEAVFCLFIVKKLSVEIAPFSHMAQSYNANEILDYYYDKSQLDSQ